MEFPKGVSIPFGQGHGQYPGREVASFIEEFIGRVNSQTPALSSAKLTSPSGWREPA